jgi:hypothetical protein
VPGAIEKFSIQEQSDPEDKPQKGKNCEGENAEN